MHPLSPVQPVLVGQAFTLRYIPAREDLNRLDVFRDRGHPQRKAVEDCPPGAVLVMDSRKDARAASAGSILVTRLMKRGVAGVVTDGGFRDSAEIARLGFPAYHQRPSAPTNLTLHQAIDIDVPIGCGDAPVCPGDVIVGDGEGVVVIPANIVDEIAEEAVEMTAFEDFVTEKVDKGGGISASIRRPKSRRWSTSRPGGRSRGGRRLRVSVAFITVGSPSSETWAATMRQPSGVRSQVWLCRPVLLEPWRRNSQLAVPKSWP